MEGIIYIEYDVLVIGCGLTGAVIARYLAEKCNKKVKILERRNHIGGNMYDYSLYSAKQWGISPNEIDPSILNMYH